ncbi:MAG TPA: DUF3795 domain-containing protein [Anaerolineales bacterium]
MPSSNQNADLIAPCGINCGVCMAYNRELKACPGCRGGDANKAPTCLRCRIKNCARRLDGEFQFCFECGDLPCVLVSRLDRRYRTNYGASPVENLLNIRSFGMEWFLASENQKWTCPECGGRLCMHRRACPACGREWHQNSLKR